MIVCEYNPPFTFALKEFAVPPFRANRTFTRWGNWPVAALCALLLAHIIVTIAAARDDDLEWFDPLIDVRGMVLQDFVEEPDPEAMRNAAISAMLATLGDPYTIWVPPALEGEFEKQLRGAYVGIGAEIGIENDRLKIRTPLADSPALEAGVRSGDVVLEIDGTDTLGFTSDDCIELLLGVAGTTVELLVRHLDETEETLSITRRPIETRSVRGSQRIGSGWTHWLDEDKGLGYIRITQFTERTANELRQVLAELDAAGLKGLILDLRFNGGGTLDGAIDTADLFLDRGAIVSVKDRRDNGRAWTARADQDDIDAPMIVLVNDSSASASEIVAGALQDNDRARVLGERTFGKGSVQEVRPLAGEHGTLKLTTARYYLPSGRNLDRTDTNDIWGVDPSPGFVIDLDAGGYADLYDARRPFDLIVAAADRPEGQWHDPSWIEETMLDPQLGAAVRSLRTRLDDGEWLAVGGDPNLEAIQLAELKEQVTFRARLVEELERASARIHELEATGNASAPIDFDRSIEARVLELRASDGAILARFRVDDAAAFAAALRAAGARLEPTETSDP